jgi:hypothetical protein
LTFNGGEWSTSHPGGFTPGKNVRIQWIGLFTHTFHNISEQIQLTEQSN